MKCPNCNFKITKKTKFCPKCGTKIPEKSMKVTQSIETELKTSDTNEIVSSKKQKMKKLVKKIIIISVAAIIVCGSIFLALYLINPQCMFRHTPQLSRTIEPTCGDYGYDVYSCEKCKKQLYKDLNEQKSPTGEHKPGGNCNSRSCVICKVTLPSISHVYKEGDCGTSLTCTNPGCGGYKVIEHKVENNTCIYCNKARVLVELPQTPIIVNSYDSRGNIEESIKITDISISSSDLDSSNWVGFSFKITRIYHENGNNYSSSGTLGWKLYNSEGEVIDSGTAYTKGNIAVGESSTAHDTAYGVSYWNNEKYTLKILNLK